MGSQLLWTLNPHSWEDGSMIWQSRFLGENLGVFLLCFCFGVVFFFSTMHFEPLIKGDFYFSVSSSRRARRARQGDNRRERRDVSAGELDSGFSHWDFGFPRRQAARRQAGRQPRCGRQPPPSTAGGAGWMRPFPALLGPAGLCHTTAAAFGHRPATPVNL